MDCDGYSSLLIYPNPVSLGAGESIYPEAEGQYSDGTTPEVEASWTISNSSVATLSGDYLTGVTGGTATLTATANPTLPVSGEYYGYNPSCDELQTYEAFTASVTVTVFDPTPAITSVTPSTFTVGTLASAKIIGSNLGTTACPMLAFPFALQSGYSTSGCSDGGFTVAFTPSAAGSGDLTLTSEGFGGQPFQSSPGQKPTANSAPITAILPPAPQITGLQQYTNTHQYISPFAPLVGTLQNPVQYMLIYGNSISQNGTVAPKICVSGACATNGAITVTGFHLGGSWALVPQNSQINIPYWVDPTATTGNYTLTLQTAGGTSSPPTTFSVLPPPAVQVTPGPETIMATTTGPDIRSPIANSIPIMANGQPSGGTFQWTTTSPLVTLTNAQSQTVTVTSVPGGYSQKAGDVAVVVVYTVGGMSSPPATSTLTVSKPQTLVLLTDTTNNTGHSCNQGTGSFTQSQSYYTDSLIGAHYTSYVRNRTYSIQDYLGNTISLSMNLFESYSPLESQITVGTGVGAAATDFFAHCSQTCRTGGTETLTSNQSIYANNFPIANKAVSWTCTAVTVVP